ncbi:MAG: hypothetical protein OK454_06630, partial [Thaumarchaeota archaeon]|nr:hypothetical protein [Nitrososphaerota archaeon]
EALILGREAPSESSNGQPPSWQMPQTVYDAESTPLSPGIEAVMMRESEEDQLAVSLRERAALQERMRELQEEENRQAQRTSEDSSQEPWFPQVL